MNRNRPGWLARLIEIVTRTNFDYSEFQGAMLAIGWGIWFLIPTFSHYVYPPHTVPAILVDVFPAPAMGIVAVILGGLQVGALLRNRPPWRRVACLGACTYWTFCWILVVQGDWRLAPVPLLFLFSLGAGWAFIRLQISAHVH